MKTSAFWYCVRLELTRERGRPHYSRFFREAAKIVFPGMFQRQELKLPETEFLFVIITENHLKHFRPVAAELTKRNRSFSVVYTNDSLFQKYTSEAPGVTFSLQALIGRDLYFRSVLFQSALLLRHIFSDARKKSVLIRFAKPAYAIRQIMMRLLRDKPLKVVLFKAEGYHANAVLLACKKLGIPSYAIQHGLIGDTSQVSDLLVDKYLVWSDFFKNRLEKRQAGCQVLVAGNAAYDAVFQALENNPPHNLDPLPLSLLVLPNSGVSHTPLEDVRALMEAVIDFAQNHPEVRVTVKPHPADQAGQARQLLETRRPGLLTIRLLDRSEPIPFHNHHLVAINNSGAGLEACIWERPLVVYSPDWDSVQVKQYIEQGVAEFVDSSRTFSDKVVKIMDDYQKYQKRCRAFTKQQLAFPGKAAEKIADLLTC